MDRARAWRSRAFSALGNRNYRLYVIGQGISLSGAWMQSIAQGLLVLRLTGSGAALGLVLALQTLPILLFGPWGGVVADRFPKRPVLYVTQSASGALALTLGVLVATGQVRIWMVFLLAFALGLVNTVDNPTRQAFVLEMVGKDDLVNAISLNSTEVNLARVVGPTIAGALIATVGLAACFLLNGLSFFAVIAMLAMMRAAELRPAARSRAELAGIRAGLAYVRSAPTIRTTLLMMALVGMLTYEFSVVLPLFAEMTFGNGAAGYAAMTAAMGLGAVIGGLYTAGRGRNAAAQLVVAALLFGATELLTTAAPTLPLAVLALVPVGFFSISFTSLGNATLQLESAPDMRGRVMALWTMAFLGTTPIGGPIIGWVGEHAGPRWGMAIGGCAAIVAAGFGWLAMRGQPRPASEPAPADSNA